MGLLVVVLGMHRSGTSYVINTLQQAGLYTGESVIDHTAPDNLQGHGESREAVAINDELFRRAGGSWEDPPATVQATPALERRIRAFVAELATHPCAGWKDPRTTLTFPLWKPHLDKYRLIACYRHPLAVARSLQARQAMPIERGVELWAHYNEALLRVLDTESCYAWIDFDAPKAELADQLQAIARDLGLPAPAPARQLFNPFLRHHVVDEPITQPHIRALYEELRTRAREASTILHPRGGQMRAQVGWTPHLAETTPPAPEDALGEIRTQIHQLSEVVELQNRLLQRLQSDMRRRKDRKSGWARFWREVRMYSRGFVQKSLEMLRPFEPPAIKPAIPVAATEPAQRKAA